VLIELGVNVLFLIGISKLIVLVGYQPVEILERNSFPDVIIRKAHHGKVHALHALHLLHLQNVSEIV